MQEKGRAGAGKRHLHRGNPAPGPASFFRPSGSRTVSRTMIPGTPERWRFGSTFPLP